MTDFSAGDAGAAGLRLIAMVVAWLFETVVMCFAMIVVVVAAFGGRWDPSSLSSVAGQDPTAVFSAMAPVMIGMMVFLSLLMGPISAIILAPFAAVYKAIRPTPVASAI